MRHTFSFKQNGSNVIILFDDKRLCEIPWNKCLEVWQSARYIGKKAEEYAKANEIIFHNAILHRAGVPIGLSDDIGILKETKKETAWNKSLRRYMPKIKGQAIVLGPRIINHGLGRQTNGKKY